MQKRKKGSGDLLALIPIGLVIVMVAALVIWKSVDTDDSTQKPDTMDTGQTSTTDDTYYNNEDDTTETDPDSSESEKDPVSLRQPPEDVMISCDDVAIYNGEFVEDGSGLPVEDVASILITNKSDQYLDYAKLTYEVDGNEAIFIVSGLNPGKSAWVLESKGLKATKSSSFVYVNALTAYKDHVVRAPKELDISYRSGMLKVKNVTDEPLENVVIYYKTVHKDGKYLGGKTYAVSFGTLESGQTVQKDAGHYTEEWTQIVRVDLSKSGDEGT